MTLKGMSVQTKVVNSSLWAAYGDALGFITELAEERTVVWRAGAPRVERVQAWRRRIGGKFGAEVKLPTGTYSDDTQLRIATSRALRGDGQFDVEAFAKIELPVWLSYALGGGRGSKAAASNLASPNVNWFTNFYQADQADYMASGGNGAAMRIQPHVWAARGHVIDEEVLLSIFRNAIVTHGHMRAVMGALFHAQCLSFVLREGQIPTPEQWPVLLRDVAILPALLARDHSLGAIWLPAWEERAKQSLVSALEQVENECLHDINSIADVLHERGDESTRYRQVLERLNAFDPKERGSATRTAIAAVALAWLRRSEPAQGIIDAANALGSDTDSIATMAGALLGATGEAEGTDLGVMDGEYLATEANRLEALSHGERTSSFGYPDLMRWTAPKTQVDVFGRTNGNSAVAGLGLATESGETFPARGRGDAAWQWVKLDFGQSLLIKRRGTLAKLPRNRWPIGRQEPAPGRAKTELPTRRLEPPAARQKAEPVAQAHLFEGIEQPPKEAARTLHELTDEAIRSGFDPRIIGQHVVDLADSTGIEAVVAYAAIIAKARVARREKGRSQRSDAESR